MNNALIIYSPDFWTKDRVIEFVNKPVLLEHKNIVPTLRSVLVEYKSDIAKTLALEIGKPISQCYDELGQCLFALENFDPIHDGQNLINGTLLIIGSLASPVLDMVQGVLDGVYVYEKILYKPSTKAAKTLSFITQIMHSKFDVNEILGIAIFEKAVLDQLIADKIFYKIINYSKIDLIANVLVENRHKNDVVIFADESCDLDIISGKIVDNLLEFQKFNSSRIQHIFVSEGHKDTLVQKLVSKIELEIHTGDILDTKTNFIDFYKLYKREKFKKTVLELISYGADLAYGEISHDIVSPLILTVNMKQFENYCRNIWAPIIFIITYEKITNLSRFVKYFINHEKIFMLNTQNTEYLENLMIRKKII